MSIELIQPCLDALKILPNDFYGGWQPEDLNLLLKYHYGTHGVDGFITDYFGAKTSVDWVPWAVGLNGAVLSTPPIPDDSVRAETIEYYALLHAIDNSNESTFTMVELGASYAPWACLAGVVAKRIGKSRINLIAVEASIYFQQLIRDNFKINNLLSDQTACVIECKALHCAVGIRTGEIFFPKVSSAFENGGQTTNEKLKIDYVGREVEHEAVPLKTLDQIFGDNAIIDFLHCDIQGAEIDVLTHGASLLTQRVKSMFIGTHSRYIEGVLIDCFHRHGWQLLRERPAAFKHLPGHHSIVGMTTRDGGQFWINSRFIEE